MASTFLPLLLFSVLAAAASDKFYDNLRKDLFRTYDKLARPAQPTNTTTVSIGISVKHIDVDEMNSLVAMDSWIILRWNDDHLKWNSSQYGNISKLHVSESEIWKPDLVPYNSADGSNIDPYGNTHALVFPNGLLLWVPPARIRFFCDLDLRLWPFDEQSCTMMIGSWTHDGNEVALTLAENNSDISELYISNAEWSIVGEHLEHQVKYYNCCAEPYESVKLTLKLRRTAPVYSAIVITPASVVVLMTLITFWLPPQAKEKLLISSCTSIFICVFLLFFGSKLPALSSTVPLVVLFYSSSLVMVAVSMVFSVVVINLATTKRQTHVPWPILNILLGCPGRLLGLGHLITLATIKHVTTGVDLKEDVDDHVITDDRRMISESPASTQYEWVLLAAAIDRILFLVYCFLFIILAGVYI